MIINKELRTDAGVNLRTEFDSLDELAGYARPLLDAYLKYDGGASAVLAETGSGTRFYGTDCRTALDVLDKARNGWDEHLDDALDVAREAVETVETTTDVVDFRPVWDVAGSVADVGAFLSGDPECMIEYPPARMTKAGRVITLCASVAYSSAIKPETLVRRGTAITALAIELSRLGLGVELYADHTGTPHRGAGSSFTFRTLIKGPNDELDPTKVLFAYAHPCMLRVLLLAAQHGMPGAWQKQAGMPMTYGLPAAPPRDLPQGTLYLPEIRSPRDVPEATEMLLASLRELGLIRDESEES